MEGGDNIITHTGENSPIFNDSCQKKDFNAILMVGILKSLKSEGLLSDEQLYSAISKVENQNTCTSLASAV